MFLLFCFIFMENKYQELFEPIEKELKSKDYVINYLKGRVKTLEDELFKDDEIKRLQEENKKLIDEIRDGFYISKEEWKEIHKFLKDKQTCSGAIGGDVTYSFTPTSIGIIGTVRCWDDEFTFRELD